MSELQREYLAEKLRDERLLHGPDPCPDCGKETCECAEVWPCAA